MNCKVQLKQFCPVRGFLGLELCPEIVYFLDTIRNAVFTRFFGLFAVSSIRKTFVYQIDPRYFQKLYLLCYTI